MHCELTPLIFKITMIWDILVKVIPVVHLVLPYMQDDIDQLC